LLEGARVGFIEADVPPSNLPPESRSAGVLESPEEEDLDRKGAWKFGTGIGNAIDGLMFRDMKLLAGSRSGNVGDHGRSMGVGDY
jgi:hypothetical protein